MTKQDSILTKMLLGIGLLMLDIKRVKVANFLPGLVIAPLLVSLWAIVEAWIAGVKP